MRRLMLAFQWLAIKVSNCPVNARLLNTNESFHLEHLSTMQKTTASFIITYSIRSFFFCHALNTHSLSFPTQHSTFRINDTITRSHRTHHAPDSLIPL